MVIIDDETPNRIKQILFFYSLFWISLIVMVFVIGDSDLAFFINANPDSDAYATFIKLFSSSLYLLIGITALGTLILLFLRNDYKYDKHRRNFITALLSYAVSYILVSSTKMIIGRDRPYVTNPNEINSFGKSESDYAMPSGHSAYSATISLTFAQKAKRIFSVILLVAYNIFMTYTRLYLGLHWVSDILVGSIMGFAISIGITLLMGKYYVKVEEDSKKYGKYETILAIIAILITIYTAYIAFM